MSMIPCNFSDESIAKLVELIDHFQHQLLINFRLGPKRSTWQVIEDYRLGLVSSHNLKAKVTYTILEQLKVEVLHPMPLNLPQMCCDTRYLDLEHCEQR